MEKKDSHECLYSESGSDGYDSDVIFNLITLLSINTRGSGDPFRSWRALWPWKTIGSYGTSIRVSCWTPKSRNTSGSW